AAVDLLAQAIVEGAATLLIAAALAPGLRDATALEAVILALVGALVVHLVFLALEHLTPSPTRHHALATHAISRGASAPFFWGGAVLAGGVLPLAILTLQSMVRAFHSPGTCAIVAVLALAGAFAWEYVWVEAGQSVPLS